MRLPASVPRLVRRTARALRAQYRLARTPFGVEHVSGPRHLDLDATDVVAVTIVRDGEFHVESFVASHLALGVSHVVLLDNGSADRTVSVAQQFDHVTVLRTLLPYGQYKHVLRRWLFDRFSGRGWCLMLDIDERFDYPLSDRLGLRGFVGYLRRRGYTGVVGQMLDLFPDGPPAAWPRTAQEMTAECRWYDHSALERVPYQPSSGVQLPATALYRYRGGIRKAVFGAGVDLTKHPLLWRAGGARPSLHSSHECDRASLADVTCLIKHYKFVAGFRQRVEEAVHRRQYYRGSSEYRTYLATLDSRPDLVLRNATARRFDTVDELVASGFLTISQAFLDYVAFLSVREAGASHTSPPAAAPPSPARWHGGTADPTR